MSAYDYTKLQSTALRMIDRFGRSATLSRTAKGTGPAHNPGAGGTETHACRAVLQEYSAFERDGTMIKVGDRKALVAARGLGMEPQAGDKYSDADGTFTVISVQTVAPGSLRLIYTLQVRR